MAEPSAPAAPEAFTVSSRGDFVPGLLWLAPAAAPRPLVLIAPPLGRGRRAPEVEQVAHVLWRDGLAAASLDLPLQGDRASAKLSARLLDCAAGSPRSVDALLWEEFLHQSALDLAAFCDALRGRPGLRAERVGCVAMEPGAAAAVAWAARDVRVRACVPLSHGADPARIARELREQLA